VHAPAAITTKTASHRVRIDRITPSLHEVFSVRAEARRRRRTSLASSTRPNLVASWLDAPTGRPAGGTTHQADDTKATTLARVSGVQNGSG
jgi:hypothetical protein